MANPPEFLKFYGAPPKP